MPRGRHEGAGDLMHATHTEPRAARRRFLCLEDDRLVQSALRRALAEHDLTLVDTTAEARILIRAQRFDAWMLDVVVPDGSGLELLSWARARGDVTPALVVTGVLDRAPVNSAQALGAEFLYKPYSVANLRAFLTRALAPSGADGRVTAVDDLIAVHELSDRETALVRCIARGVARMDLAEVLGVSDNTVKSHIRRLLRKTGHKRIAHLYRDLAGPIR